MDAERHPLKPFLPSGMRILMLGSFPPSQKRWCMDFFYPNFINDHWRIMGQIFFCNKDFFVDNKNKTFLYEKILDFVEKHHIGYYDTAEAVHRLKDNASDKYLDIVKKTDLRELLANAPKCRHIITTLLCVNNLALKQSQKSGNPSQSLSGTPTHKRI